MLPMRLLSMLAAICLLLAAGVPAAAADLSVDDILAGVEARYKGPGFSARFFQESTLKAMDISDTAEGFILIKRPDMMRWEYEKPEYQLIVTDGDVLWIYRPEDRQVMIGDAPDYFGGGKGAGFLSDIRSVRENFIVVPGESDAAHHVLKLLPKEDKYNVESIRLFIARDRFEIVRVVTENRFGDETRLAFSELTFGLDPKDSLFRFEVPAGTDVLQLGE
ncbi:MAG: outer membrane lipoprotein carrier protein LolA [Desulfobacterales bacterium]|nr:outer membrane lipoprotein carrier protein LolA [Desulfobacterales bacterium]MCF8081139.1 outer membrane lipoprotein carrier protein LolA [Desulfobacterales bacterium]